MKFHWIPFKRLQRSWKCRFPIGPKNKNLVEDVEKFLFVKFRWILFEVVENISANKRPVWASWFSDQPEKNTNLVEDVLVFRSARNFVEDVEILFRWIPSSRCRIEVQHLIVKQMPWQPYWFSDWPEKHKLGEGRLYIASCLVVLNFV